MSSGIANSSYGYAPVGYSAVVTLRLEEPFRDRRLLDGAKPHHHGVENPPTGTPANLVPRTPVLRSGPATVRRRTSARETDRADITTTGDSNKSAEIGVWRLL